ncbi:hypothetical protein RVW00_004716 [Enterobacter bugandensis]|nr:hypothetical protein [Enterobacter bugandensis]
MSLFEKYLYAPDELSYNIRSYRDYHAGIRYKVLHPISIFAGYRQAKYCSSDYKNKTLAEGIYLGGSV